MKRLVIWFSFLFISSLPYKSKLNPGLNSLFLCIQYNDIGVIALFKRFDRKQFQHLEQNWIAFFCVSGGNCDNPVPLCCGETLYHFVMKNVFLCIIIIIIVSVMLNSTFSSNYLKIIHDSCFQSKVFTSISRYLCIIVSI